MFIKFWQNKCSINPQLIYEDKKLTLPIGSFKDELKKAYNAGAKDKALVAKEFEKLGTKDGPFTALDKILGKFGEKK